MTRLLVLGATGDVGRGIVREAAARGWSTVAVSRNPNPAIFAGLAEVETVAADVSAAEELENLLDHRPAVSFDAAVVATNPTAVTGSALEVEPAAWMTTVTATVAPHLVALRTLVPRMREQALVLGIGGGMADLALLGYGAVSAAQAAVRALYRTTAKEAGSGPDVRELLIRSMVAGDSNRDRAPRDWVTDAAVGRVVCDLVAADRAGGTTIVELGPYPSASSASS